MYIIEPLTLDDNLIIRGLYHSKAFREWLPRSNTTMEEIPHRELYSYEDIEANKYLHNEVLYHGIRVVDLIKDIIDNAQTRPVKYQVVAAAVQNDNWNIQVEQQTTATNVVNKQCHACGNTGLVIVEDETGECMTCGQWIQLT